MHITKLGKFIVLILLVGAAVGGWRVWQNLNSKSGGGAATFPSNNGGSNNGGGGGNSGNVSSSGTAANADSSGDGGTFTGGAVGQGNEILLVTSNTKKGWLLDEIGKFNASNGSKYRVVTRFIETREAMHAILDGKIKPAIWSPSSTIWTARLSQAWQQKTGNAIIDRGNADAYRVFFRSPLVFLTTKSKVATLRPLLKNWDTFRQKSGTKVSWGKLKWSHADPLTANSGMMTLGLILADYTNQTGADPGVAADSAKFRAYLQGIERGLVFDLPARGGSSALAKAFLRDTSRYDFISTYESNAIEAAQNDPTLAVIYPSPTVVSESVGAILKGDWLSETQRQGARAFLNFLGSETSMREGLQYYFRPAQSGGALTLAPILSQLRAQGFQQSFTSIELPPYEALNSAAFQWRLHVAHQAAP